MKLIKPNRIFNQKFKNLSIARFVLSLTSAGILCFATACSSSKKATINTDFSPSTVQAESLIVQMPNFGKEINTISGKGRALVSEPGNSERVTVEFEANKEISLLTIRNRIGIEGGQLLVDQDSILIYNKIDKKARKIALYDGRLTSLNELASINIIELLNFTIQPAQITYVFESKDLFQIQLKNKAEVYINKKDFTILRVIQQNPLRAPYSEIIYEGYGEISNFKLPRQITIISAEQKSKVVFLIRSLDINPKNLSLEADIPNDLTIERL